MNTTIQVVLGGTSFTLDEPAYRMLRAYLDRAAARLGNHPDRADVLAGLESSIAAKLARRASTGAVCDETALAAALHEVGRVDGPDLGEPESGEPEFGEPEFGEPESGEPEFGEPEPTAAGYGARWRTRRLYRLRQGQQIAGVCTGLAAFAEIDVGIVRLVCIVGALFTGGLLLAIYVVLMFAMPVAHTDDEIAAAHGGRWPPTAASS